MEATYETRKYNLLCIAQASPLKIEHQFYYLLALPKARLHNKAVLFAKDRTTKLAAYPKAN